MIHHSSKDYKTAVGEAAVHGRQKMEAIIATGEQSARRVIEQVETQIPIDRIAQASRLQVQPNSDGFSLIIPGLKPAQLHEHALRQVAEKAGLHGQYLTNLRKIGEENPDEEWPGELITNNINTLLQHSRSRHLIRSLKYGESEEVRGFLSDSFRRLDSRPLLFAFIEACQLIGALPIEGYALDTRVKMRAVLPHVFEPIPGEVMLFGLEWSNSDFGAGGHAVSMWVMRVVCTNLATANEVMRQIHLGKRLDDNISYSQKTYDLDNRTNASALKDTVLDTLSANRVNGYLELVKEASEQEIKSSDVGRILKAKLSKGDLEKVQDLFEGQDVLNLPAGNTKYRLSNAVSWFANSKDMAADKKLDLQRLAGELLPQPKTKVREV